MSKVEARFYLEPPTVGKMSALADLFNSLGKRLATDCAVGIADAGDEDAEVWVELAEPKLDVDEMLNLLMDLAILAGGSVAAVYVKDAEGEDGEADDG